MNPSRLLFLSSASLLLANSAAQAQITLNGLGPGTLPGNYGTLPTTTAFAKDLIANGAFAPTHTIPNLKDGQYGNAHSWIGDSANSFAGLSFGATPLPLGQVAWGRSLDFLDRAQGIYTLQYTATANPGAATPDAAWINLGIVNYEFDTVNSPISMGLRHVWNFTPVMATGIRLIGSSNGICIDELEAGAFAPTKLTLTSTGGAMPGGNIALASAGATAFAKDLLGNGSFAPSHTIPNLNDGIYGNSNSWIGDTESSFAGVRLAAAQTINRIAFGRDNLAVGGLEDRDSGNYLIQYTTVANPNGATPDASWNELGEVFYDPSDPTANKRHEYSFAPVPGVTGIRIYAPGNGIGSGRAIDEIEVFAVPEPASAAFLVLGAAALASRRRRK